MEPTRGGLSLVESSPIHRTPESLVDVPCKSSPDHPTTTWSLSANDAEVLRCEYPEVDPISVCEDMARKIRAGAYDTKCAAETKRQLARWVDQESRWLVNRKRSATKVDMFIGSSPERLSFGYSNEDYDKYHDYEEFQEYCEECGESCGWDSEIKTWPGFEVWLQSKGLNLEGDQVAVEA